MGFTDWVKGKKAGHVGERQVIKIEFADDAVMYTLNKNIIKKAAEEDALRSQVSVSENLYQAVIHSDKGGMLDEAGKHEEAIVELDKAIKLEPKVAYFHMARGVVLEHLEKYNDALVSANTAIKLSPKFAVAHYNRGIALSRMRRYREAIEEYDIAIKIKPNVWDYHNEKGFALAQLEKYEEAAEELDKAIRSNPEYDEISHQNRASVLGRLAEKRDNCAIINCKNSVIEKCKHCERYFCSLHLKAYTNYEEAYATPKGHFCPA